MSDELHNRWLLAEQIIPPMEYEGLRDHAVDIGANDVDPHLRLALKLAFDEGFRQAIYAMNRYADRISLARRPEPYTPSSERSGE